MSFARKLLVSLVSLIVVCLIAISVLWVLTVRQRTVAEAFLRDAIILVPGKSSFEEAQQLARKYGGIPWYTGSNDMRCTFQRCTFRFLFENKPLTSVRLARYVELIGWIYVRDGTVVGREIEYVRDSGAYSPFQYEVIEAPMWNEDGTAQRQREVGLWRLKVDGTGMPSIVKVTLDPSSSPAQRKRAYSLDLSCLANLLGCDSPSAMFPHGIPYRGVLSQTHSEAW
jgi:hypothetical protein